MKQVNFYKGNKRYSLIINNIKYLYGNNYILKYELMNILRQVLNKTSSSEMQIETNSEVKIDIDNHLIKKGILFEVNQFFDLQSDLKMQSKSLIMKYYETYLRTIELKDEFLALNSMFLALSNILNQDDSLLTSKFIELNEKQLIKLISPLLMKDEMFCNAYDLNYEEIILFQLDLINYIVSNNFDQQYFIILDLPLLNASIIKKIEKMKGNVMIFILTNQSLEVTNINDYCIITSSIIDLADEQYLFDYIVEKFPTFITLEEVNQEMKNIISNHLNERTKIVIKMIE